MNKFILLILCASLYSCSLIEPSTLVIQNNSAYSIKIKSEKGNIKEFDLNKGKGDFILLEPGDVKFKIMIDSIGFEKEYCLNLKYLEKRQFKFKIGE
jgi:hypothetical protein